MDCIKAVDFIEKRDEINIDRLYVTGASQGGGLSLATAALDKRPKLVIAEIPYLCNFKRAIEWAEEVPNVTYLEFHNILRKFPERENEMYRTLSYFDNLNLADKIKSRTIISCTMQDKVTPPSTIFSVFNHIKTEKQMVIMPYCTHSSETSINFVDNKLRFIKSYL